MLRIRIHKYCFKPNYCPKNYSTIKQVCLNSNFILKSPFTDVKLVDLNLSEYIWKRAERWKHWPALTCAITGRSYTYGEARAAAERLSISLPNSAGLRPGDTVGLVMPNVLEFPLTMLGAIAAGLVISPANPIYTPEELARQFVNCGVRAVVTTLVLLDKVQAALEMVPGGAQIVVATDGGGAEEAALAAQPHASSLLSLHEMLRREYTRHTPRALRPDPDSLAFLPYSSGTTGLPKGVMLSHRILVSNLRQMQNPSVFTPPQNEVQDVMVALLPLFHIYGLQGVLCHGLSEGGHLIIMPRFEPQHFVQIMKKFKPTVLSLVPPLLMFMVDTPDLSQQDLSCIRFVICGAAPVSRELIQRFLEKTKNKSLDFREAYGLTETSCLVTIMPKGAALSKVGSCGVPIPLSKVIIVDDEGNALPRGKIGELWMQGPQVMLGYHNNEEATRETLTDDGWLRTGDVAYIDDEGFVYIVDRMKELIKVKGLQVSPTELEGVLRQMENITDVAVVGVPDERCGEVPRAFVVRRANSNITENDVKTFLQDRVAPFKRLKGGVEFIEAIPKNASGKTLRKNLKNIDR